MLDYFSFIISFLLVFMRPSSHLWKYMGLSKKVNCTITSHMLFLSLETCQSSLRIEIIFSSFFFLSQDSLYTIDSQYILFDDD